MSTRTTAGLALLSAVVAAWCAALAEPTPTEEQATMHITDIRIRDPFVLPDPKTGLYYLIASRGNRQRDAKGWEIYVSTDLRRWRKPVTVYEPAADHWGQLDFWAPELHEYKGRFYLFGTIRGEKVPRGTQVLVADAPLGPYRPLGPRPQTPKDWVCLDGTLWIEGGQPWMVFCHEWVQIGDGTICAMPLAPDLSKATGEPVELFKASSATWVRPIGEGKYVTDAPCLCRTKAGTLLMLWSSFCKTGYAVGIARSESGKITGPWKHDDKPLFTADGGHPMLFRTFEGQLTMLIHQPNGGDKERAKFLPVEEKDGTLVLRE
jgi:GH43 family beta-xylosidase